MTPEQIELIRAWIAQGAPWQDHWSFIPPQRPEPPAVEAKKDWAENPIDAFILKQLNSKNLAPSPDADLNELMRRASLTLTGLPPVPKEIQSFKEGLETEAESEIYEAWVDRLLDSPRYGEHLARYWMDAARYGDTHGLHLDNERSIWPYRDWVIRAFNDNMPFDRFTVEQIAGDLLPDPSVQQLTATGFNRSNVTTSEGGAIPEEFAVRYAVDRISTVSTVWMGLTTGCAQCHDHKFDPITQKEFYRMFAFYNSLDENPMDGNALLPPPSIRVTDEEDRRRLREFDRKIDSVRKAIRLNAAAQDYRDPLSREEAEALSQKEFVWLEDSIPEGANRKPEEPAWEFVRSRIHPVYSGERSLALAGEGPVQRFFNADEERGLRVGEGDRLFAYVFLDPENPPKAVMLQFHDGENWDHRAFWGEDVLDFGKSGTPGRHRAGDLPEFGEWVRLEIEAKQVGFKPGERIAGWSFTQQGGSAHWDRAGIVSRWPQGEQGFDSLAAWERYQSEIEKPALPGEVQEALKTPPDRRGAAARSLIQDYFVKHVWQESRTVFDPLHRQIASLRKAKSEYESSIPRTMITRELEEPRTTHVLKRGEYDNKGEEVTPGVPAALPPLPPDAPRNRLGLARWLVQPEHPLTSRVIVNRFWQQHFGVGLVKTAEDFGSQGEPPTHPGLLDWLAVEFRESGWDVRHIQRLIVTSAAYRQSSNSRPELENRDPNNRWIARGPRYRMDAEMIRDNALALSGLIVQKIGGHGVKPYQPDGLWEAVAYPTSTTSKFVQDHGEDLYRRSLYTFWKRTSPPPAMTAFDAPSRESCVVRRERTNTPLQALVLMNDVQFFEAARAMAERILLEGGSTLDGRLTYAFRLAVAREPGSEELAVLRDVYQKHRQEFRNRPEDAKALIQTGESERLQSADPEALAAWTMVASLLLNLDETITIN